MPVESSIVRSLEQLLAQSSFGLPFTSLRVKAGFSTRIHRVAMGLAELATQNRVALSHGIYWTLMPSAETSPSPPAPGARTIETADHPAILGDPAFIGPVWEPTFALKLWAKGLRIVQQYPAEGYYLDIALVTDDGRVRLDVEVDGRTTHCDRLGRRKIGDIVRDARLSTAGWFIRRFWVAELMRDMDGCVEQVTDLWGQLIAKEP